MGARGLVRLAMLPKCSLTEKASLLVAQSILCLRIACRGGKKEVQAKLEIVTAVAAVILQSLTILSRACAWTMIAGRRPWRCRISWSFTAAALRSDGRTTLVLPGPAVGAICQALAKNAAGFLNACIYSSSPTSLAVAIRHRKNYQCGN